MSRVPLPPLPAKYRMAAWIRPALPVLAWGLMAMAALGLYQGVQIRAVVPGFAQSLIQRVGTEQGGRLFRLEVQLHARVSAGQLLARLHNPTLDLDLQSARASLEEARRRLALEAHRWRNREASRRLDGSTLSWRIARDRYLTEIADLRERASQAEDKARLAGIAIELVRIRGLEKDDVVSASELNLLRTDHDSLDNRIRERIPLLRSLALNRARALRDFESLSTEDLIDSTNERLQHGASLLKIQELEIQKAELALASLDLRSAKDGVVSQILKQPGELIAAGETVLEIMDSQANSIEAWIPEDQILGLEIGRTVRLYRKADPRSYFESRIVELGASLRVLPARINQGQVPPRYGLPIQIAIPKSLHLRSGELFQVALD
jgi:multidrug resistance efflux pump